MQLLILLFLCLIPWYAMAAWPTDEVRTFVQMGREGKCVAIFFPGSPNCPWSSPFAKAVLYREECQEKLRDQCLLLEVSDRHPKREHLLTLFHVKRIPSVVLIDPEGEVIEEMGCGGENLDLFITNLKQKIEDFTEVKQFVSSGDFDVDEGTLRTLYSKSQRLESPFYARKICDEGMKREEGHFFHLQKYGSLLKTLSWDDPRLKSARDALLERSQQASAIAFSLAMIDFKHFSKKKERGQSPETPLLHYIEGYQEKDLIRTSLAQEALARYFLSCHEEGKARQLLKTLMLKAPEKKRGEFLSLLEKIPCEE